MNRLEKFHSLKEDAWYSRLYKKLKKQDIEICEEFIRSSEELNYNDFEFKLNRHFLDTDKPKNWKIISELLMTSNSRK